MNTLRSKKISAALIIFIVITGMVFSHPLYFMQSFLTAEENQLSASTVNNVETPSNISQVSSQYNDNFWHRSDLIWNNGLIAYTLNIKGYYSDSGVLVYDGNYIVSTSAKTSTDYEVNQMKSLEDFLSDRGIKLMYVNAPTKYLDDTIIINTFGIDSYTNRNADVFVQRMRDETNIPVIDLRDNIRAENKNIYTMFYRTDHHWTVPSGLWASRIVAKSMNEHLGFNIDLSALTDENFSFTHYEKAWVGEQGSKISEGYIGRDDFVCIEPINTNMSFSITNLENNNTVEGGFELLCNKSRYETEGLSWHYSYMPNGINASKIINHNVAEGKILLLCDSFSYVIVPFLSQVVHEITTIIPRNYNGDILSLIDANQYDSVIILYAPFMIGAHDNPKSANYKMFSFNQAIE